MPRVSVCIPAYQQPAYVRRAIESVFVQDFLDFEVIVTDDSETDEVFGALEPWRRDERLIYHRNAIRQGSPGNWNAAMKLARSGLVKFLHHDDWFAKRTALAQFVGAMDKTPRVDLAFSASNSCDPSGRLVSVNELDSKQFENIKDNPASLHYGNLIGAPSATIFRKTEGFEFDLNLKWVVDVDAYLTLLGNGGVLDYIDEALVSTTTGAPHQVTREFESDAVARVCEHLYLYSKHRPSAFGDRMKGLRFLVGLVRKFDKAQLVKLIEKRQTEAIVREEKIAVGLRCALLGLPRPSLYRGNSEHG